MRASAPESSHNSAKTAASISSPLPSTDEAIPEMVFRASITEGKVAPRWLKGLDSVLWDSFCGRMRRKLTDSVAMVKRPDSKDSVCANVRPSDTSIYAHPIPFLHRTESHNIWTQQLLQVDGITMRSVASYSDRPRLPTALWIALLRRSPDVKAKARAVDG